ncbi:hypothetical protein DPMN_094463 [Dreissena polymorpha]|uniref:Uncharacterized protein n=1 Tax=Dreissena polymorpha TaxID=45954 RepID=A0A9D4L654_DREPO|nr:hypothetical protein DPMN_094463 [Dreissena polymorpha]
MSSGNPSTLFVIETDFKLAVYFIGTNVLTNFKFGSDFIGANVLTNVKNGSDFIGAYVLTEFNEDWAIYVASRVFTSFSLEFDLLHIVSDFIGTHVLTKFHENWSINASVESTCRTTNKEKVTTKANH